MLEFLRNTRTAGDRITSIKELRAQEENYSAANVNYIIGIATLPIEFFGAKEGIDELKGIFLDRKATINITSKSRKSLTAPSKRKS